MIYNCDLYSNKNDTKYFLIGDYFVFRIMSSVGVPSYKIEDGEILFDLNEMSCEFVYPWKVTIDNICSNPVEENVSVNIVSGDEDGFIVGYYKNNPFYIEKYYDPSEDNIYEIETRHSSEYDEILDKTTGDYNVKNISNNMSVEVSETEKENMVEELIPVTRIGE